MIRKIGIRREDKNLWERRVPLVPSDVEKLSTDYGFEVFVQPSKIRVFPDEEYQNAKATLQEDLTNCDIVLGVKEMPVAFFKRAGMYMFFSHTIKGQPQNMPMLKLLTELGCSLIDYERITDDKGRRLVFFGHYAGLAGMIDSLWAFGKRLSHEGLQTPFSRVRRAFEYSDLNDAKESIKAIGKQISQEGLPKNVSPVIIGFAGYGNVSKGAQEIFDLLPHRQIEPKELLSISNSSKKSFELIKVVFKEEHTVKHKTPKVPFEKSEFFEFPDRYESDFFPYAEKLSVLINCIYWTPKSPRLLSIREAKTLWGRPTPPRLKVIGDISCDVRGGIEINLKETQPDKPVYVYDFTNEDYTLGIEGNGPVVMAVDNLPCELSAESSQEFSRSLMPLLPNIAKIDSCADFSRSNISGHLKKAVILWRGEFTPEFEFMKDFM